MWYQNFDDLWGQFTESDPKTDPKMSFSRLKKFLEDDVEKSKALGFVEKLVKEYPNRKIYTGNDDEIDPYPHRDWWDDDYLNIEHKNVQPFRVVGPCQAPIFLNTGTDIGYVMVRWDEYIFSKKECDECDIELTKIIAKCAGDSLIGRLMCDGAACHGYLNILHTLHESGLEGDFEIGSAVDGAEDELEGKGGSRVEILKYLYFERKAPYDNHLKNAIGDHSLGKHFKCIEYEIKMWEGGVYNNDNIKGE